MIAANARATARALAATVCVAAAQPAAVTAQTAAAAQAAGGGVVFSLRSEHHSDALALAGMGHDDWAAVVPRAGRNLALIDDEARLGWQFGHGALQGWRVAAVARSQATLVATEQALTLAAQVARGQRPATDTDWQTDVQLRGFTGAGLALGRGHALDVGLPGRWQAQWEVQALALGRWRERSIRGPVHFNAAQQRYGFALQSDEYDNRLALPFQATPAAHGAGLLGSASLAWTGERAWAQAALRDGGWLQWRALPRQQAVLDTATQTVDGDGFLVYQPLVQGQNSQATRRRWQTLRSRWAGGLLLADGQRAGVQLDYLPGWGGLPTLTWQRPAPAAVAGAGRWDLRSIGWGAEWHLHERRLTLSLDWQGLSLRAGLDRLGSAARSREWALTWQQGF